MVSISGPNKTWFFSRTAAHKCVKLKPKALQNYKLEKCKTIYFNQSKPIPHIQFLLIVSGFINKIDLFKYPFT